MERPRAIEACCAPGYNGIRVTTALLAFSACYTCCNPVHGFVRSASRASTAGGFRDCRTTVSSQLSVIVTSPSPLLLQARGQLKRTRGGGTTCLNQQFNLGHDNVDDQTRRRRRSLLFSAESSRSFFSKTFSRRRFSLATTPPSDDSGDVTNDDSANPNPAHLEIGVGTGAEGVDEDEFSNNAARSVITAGLGLGDAAPAARVVAAEGREGGDVGAAVGTAPKIVDRKPRKARWSPPDWAVNVHPGVQAAASVSLYLFHMLYLSKSGITFPIQLIPNNHGLTQSVGLDTAAGFAVLGAAGWARVKSGMPLFPPLNSSSVPWGWNRDQVKKRLPPTFFVLMAAYLLSGWGSQLCEYLLYILSFAGINMSVAMHRSVQVLMSHMVWVVMGVRILGFALRPFFNRKKGSWVGMKWKSNWLWWVTGGYFVSSALFNIADLANQFVCPLPPDTESVVVKIINPENNDIAAMAVGSIAPCISAPWWEEVLYRGFLLPALTLYLPLKGAVPVGSLLFAAHHMNLQAMLPLSVLGLVWSLLYIYSGNLLVTVLIHAMWNSRVFLGSLLGL